LFVTKSGEREWLTIIDEIQLLPAMIGAKKTMHLNAPIATLLAKIIKTTDLKK